MSDILSEENEIEVICAQCEFPTVTEYDEKGKVIGFKELAGPKTYDEAIAEGWLDHGMGLYCPSCSLKYMEELQRDQDVDAKSGMAGDILEVTDAMALRSLCPGLSDDTYEQFTKMYRIGRIQNARAQLGLPSVGGYIPVPKTEKQGEEFVKLAAVLQDAYGKLDDPTPVAQPNVALSVDVELTSPPFTETCCVTGAPADPPKRKKKASKKEKKS